MIPSKEKLEEITKELQKIMRIQDWDITVEYCSDRKMQELTGEYNYACCERNIRLHTAKVFINKDHEGINEWYSTLVHELYHIVTNNLYYIAGRLLDYTEEPTRTIESNTFKNYYEQMIEDLAKGFVNAYPVTNFIKEDDTHGKENA